MRVEHAYEAIVSEELFYSVEKKLSKKYEGIGFNEKNHTGIPRKEDRYNGLIYCGKCGRRMRYQYSVAKEVRKYFFACGNALEHDDGKGFLIMEDRLNEAVCAEIRNRVQRFSEKGVTVAGCEKAIKEDMGKYEKSIDSIRKQYERIEE